MPTLREQLKERPKRFAAAGVAPRAVVTSPWAEDAMRYFRQDIDLSDHHLHWHALYPAFLRDSSGSVEPKRDIQGRLFLYMHQQMLARYNTDRRAVGLPLVVPLLKWDTPDSWKTAFEDTTLPADALAPWITESRVHDFHELNYIGFDEKNSSPNQNAPDDVTRVLKGLKHVLNGITGRTYHSYNAVGADLEASNPDFDNTDLQGGPHNIGHMALATPHNDHQQYFVMANPEVAMTTPVFYRWHRVIDDFGFAWQGITGAGHHEICDAARRGAARHGAGRHAQPRHHPDPAKCHHRYRQTRFQPG
jgi:tyrosinase